MKTEKKDLIKVIAVAAAGVIAGTGVTAAAFGTANKTEDTENTSAASSQVAETTATGSAACLAMFPMRCICCTTRCFLRWKHSARE